VLEIDSDDERLNHITWSCNSVRSKIRNFINSGEMKVGAFQTTLGVSSQAYGRFMGQNGQYKGSGCDTYFEAHKFFKKRGLEGKKTKAKRVKKGEEKVIDFSDVHLDGEDDGSVPVYDTCDEVRRKIRAHFVLPGVTQAAFLREAAKALQEGKKIQSKLLNDFLSKKGASAGNTSSVFYASYVFFEKMRIKQGKPKSKHRLEMEKYHPKGFDISHRLDYVMVLDGESVSEDKYGCVHIGPGRR
jgi:hypothetical protein